MNTVPINKHLQLIEAPEGGKFPFCYCVVIEDQIRGVIDTGFRATTAEKLRNRGLDVVINSHFHLDHILKNQELGEVEVWCHSQDAPAIRSPRIHMSRYGFYDDKADDLAQCFIDGYRMKDGVVHRELEDGIELDFGRTRLRVIHTPGHTPGHCVFYEENTGILISADIDLGPYGPWYQHLCSDIEDLITSIEVCAALNPQMVVSGHQGIITKNISTRFISYKDLILKKNQEIYNSLIIPHTLDELSQKRMIFGSQSLRNPYFRFYEKQGVLKHLERLIKQGLIRQEYEVYYRI